MDLRSVTRRVPGLVLTEHELDVPLDHGAPGGETITVFAREVAEPDGLDKPFLVFFQGGPGHEAPRPGRREGWLDRALQDFRVLLLDQRGTGRSSPVVGPQTAERLAHFRADAIVRDAELLREALGVERWSVLGQSFGGFCVLRYLSSAPDALREALLTGGLPVLGPRIDEVYAYTWALVAERTRRFLERYPEDRERVPDTAKGRAFGSVLGALDGAEQLHHLLELDPASPAFEADARDFGLAVTRNPLYAVLHEACWADGGATRWAAQRTRPPDAWLSGEHVLPELLEDHPLRDVAHELAGREWPRLYDEAVLAANEVPAAAAIYADDMYVPRALSEETAAAVRGLRPWLTSELEHDGLRTDGARVLSHLLDLARGRA